MAVVLLFLWGWRELGIRVAIERVASREAEARLAGESSAVLADRLTKLLNELANVTNVYTIDGLDKGSARIFVDARSRGVLVISNAKKGNYELRTGAGQTLAAVEVPKSGQKTMLLDHLPPAETIKFFALAPR